MLRVAAGPRIGFGHLLRAVSLCRAAGVDPVVSLRGGQLAAATARRFGCVLVHGSPRRALRRQAPMVLVVDDPSPEAALAWVRAARHLQIPVAAMRDCGIGAGGSDLVVDGSPRARRACREGRQLLGPRFMVLDPAFVRARGRRRRHAGRPRVAVALGGGVHAAYAEEVTALLEGALGAGCVRVAPGFVAGRQHPHRSGRFAHAQFLAQADVALVAGGIGLYEACCVGVPTVAVAVTPGQRSTVRAFAELGAVVDGGSLAPGRPRTARRLAGRVLRVLDDPRAKARLAARARRAVDGGGGARVAAALRRLAAAPTIDAPRGALG